MSKKQRFFFYKIESEKYIKPKTRRKKENNKGK